LSNKDYINIIAKKINIIISFIKCIHFNENKPENHNIYMNNETDNYVFVFDGQKWNTVDKTSFFNEIYEKKVYYYIKNFMNYIVN